MLQREMKKMIDIKFDDYFYYPTLRTRTAELKGLEMLDPARKASILPLITLGKWPKSTDFRAAAEKAGKSMDGAPFLLDLTNDALHLADQQLVLRDPSNGYENWRNFVAEFDKSIPIVQMSAESKTRDVTRQAQEFERTIGKLGFRIKDYSSETRLVINALSALDDPTNAIVFIDCQYIRNALAAFVTAAIATINEIRSEFPEAIICVLSTSFPSSTIPFVDGSQKRGSINILERELHSRIGGNSIAIYGDHGSIHSVVYDDVSIMMRWASRVDYPREFDWYFERRPGDQSAQGYCDAAAEILKTDSDIGSRDIWGEKMIIDAAAGNPHAKAPASWIAVRVNIHLSRQIDLSARLVSGNGENLDDLF